MAKTDVTELNPALKALEILIGEWEMELSNASFLPNPSDTAKGKLSIEEIEKGAFLRMRMNDDATWLFSRDDSRTDYNVFYYDSRKVSRLYEMSFAENKWRIWRNSPTFSQRYEGEISRDGNTITGRWEKSDDGNKWEHDFNVTYRRK
jgi:hypothetical protein